MKKAISLLILSFMAISLAFAQEQPKREFRGAWLHIVGNQKIKTMSMEEIQKWFTSTLDTLQSLGCNAVIFQVRPQADAFYQSDLEPWTRFLTGEQGAAPNPFWDPLEFMVEECHSRGMELHAWFNPYRVTSNDNERLHPDHLYFKKPDIFKRYGKQLFFDPGEPEARKHTVNVIADIVTRYDVDAIHFDDYFYPYPVKFEEFHDDDSFSKYGKEQGFEYWQKNDWRRNNVAILIKEVNDTIKSIKPWIRFGISPFGIHRNLKDTPDGSGSRTNGLSNYEELFADVPDWAEKGYIDYIAPQLYWKIGHSAACYDILIHWWNDSNFKGHLYIGQSLSSFSEPDTDNPQTTQMRKKMEMVRELPNVDGNVWWPGWSFISDPKVRPIADSLETVYQSHISLIPAYTDIDSIAPEAVKSIKAGNGAIRWSVNPTIDVLQMPHFFVVYRFPSKGKIDIEDGSAIVCVTKELKFVPKEAKNGKYRYVVTVMDKCWNESEPSASVIW